MRMQEVKIKLKDGKIYTECEGFVATECETVAEIENTLGTIDSREATSEAYIEVNELPEFVKQGIK